MGRSFSAMRRMTVGTLNVDRLWRAWATMVSTSAADTLDSAVLISAVVAAIDNESLSNVETMMDGEVVSANASGLRRSPARAA